MNTLSLFEISDYMNKVATCKQQNKHKSRHNSLYGCESALVNQGYYI